MGGTTMNERIIGIDLGTTNSEVSIVQNGKAILIPIELDGPILPSAVGIGQDKTLLVGREAKNQYVLYPENTVLNVKRHMGTEKTLTLADKPYLPEEISAIILKQLKSRAEAYLKSPVSKAVITVPAYFSDVQRQATKKAGELAGLDVVRIINEPTAAALVYNAAQEAEKKILVYDLGGGTFDVSIVLMRQQVVEVIASHGNNQLGGNDFDDKIVAHIEKQLAEKNIDITANAKAQARIRRAAELAKITLSDNPYAQINEEYLVDDPKQPFHLSLELTRTDYEAMITPYIDETLEAIHIALQSANLTASDIDEILLVGGSTKTPIIAARLEAEFNCPLHAEIDPDLCVAMGAAIQAAVISGDDISTTLVDITPYTFGTSCLGELHGFFSEHTYKPIIKKNTPIPVTKSEAFYTVQDRQESVEVKIYQGEDEDARNNIKLGEFTIDGLSKVDSGNPIVFSLQLDLNGILQVTAKEKKTGLQKSITINNAFKASSERELIDAKQRIDSLFSDDGPTANDNLVNAAHETIKEAQQHLDALNDEDKEHLIELIAATKDALDNCDLNALEKNIEAIRDMLHYCLEAQ